VNKRIVAALRVVAAKTYYHGSPEPLELGPLKDINKTWTAFDNKIMKEPFWLTPDLSYLRRYEDHPNKEAQTGSRRITDLLA